MSRPKTTLDEMVDAEIARLQASPDVKLAKKEQNLIYRRRQYMWSLQNLEKRGKQLRAEGWTMETLPLKFETEESI